MIHNQLRAYQLSALVGALAWGALLVLLPAEQQTPDLIARLLLLAILVFVPLALGLVESSAVAGQVGGLRRAIWLQPFAAATAVAAFMLPAGVLAGALALGWLLFAGIVALLGLVRLFGPALRDPAELCIQVALLWLPAGGFWLAMARFGAHPLGFGDTIVLLTAVHFHYAGFALLILAGLAGRRLRASPRLVRNSFALVAAGIIVGVPLVALGITFSRELEILAVLLLVSSVLAFALLTLAKVVPLLARRHARVLLAISALSSVATMLLAAGYALGSLAGFALTIPQMVWAPGVLNAVGLVLCGLLAWTFELQDKNQ
jgi:hypothetical protein